jgi:hypothetical protein
MIESEMEDRNERIEKARDKKIRQAFLKKIKTEKFDDKK